jgi:hypothetical protein
VKVPNWTRLTIDYDGLRRRYFAKASWISCLFLTF